ncbi:MAG: SH3 domain-containing protein [Spirochaetota bacterium]
MRWNLKLFVFVYLIFNCFSVVWAKAYFARSNARNGLFMRQRPGTKYKKIGSIPFKAQVKVVDRFGPKDKIGSLKGYWLKVDYNGKVGWAFSGFLSVFQRKSAISERDFTSRVYTAWLKLGESHNHCKEFDYFPDGGMRSFYCHLQEFLSYRELQSYVGIPIFQKGPHSRGSLDLNSKSSFGHYNPAFVNKLAHLFIPSEKGSLYHKFTQPIYDKYVRPLARTFLAVFVKLHKNRSFWKKEADFYEEFLQEGKQTASYDYEKFYDFMHPEYIKDGSINTAVSNQYLSYNSPWEGNVVKTVVAFWVRRRLDRTYDEFYRGLVALLKVYDKAFLYQYASKKP